VKQFWILDFRFWIRGHGNWEFQRGIAGAVFRAGSSQRRRFRRPEPGRREYIPPAYRRIKGVKYIYSGQPEWLDTAPMAKVIQEAQQAGKK